MARTALQPLAIVAWESAVAIAGALMREVEGEYPPRFQASGSLDATMCERLQAAALD